MFKKVCLGILAMLLLSSCGWDDSVSEGASVDPAASKKWLSPFETSSFSLGIPAAWEVVNNIDGLLPKPNNGSIELAANSVDTQNGFANNILILSQDLTKTTSSSDFSLLNNIGVEREYNEYTKLDMKDITFSSGDVSKLYNFEARYNVDSPKLKFIQTAAVCADTKWYLLTIALPVGVTDISKYEDILQTFNCK